MRVTDRCKFLEAGRPSWLDTSWVDVHCNEASVLSRKAKVRLSCKGRPPERAALAHRIDR